MVLHRPEPGFLFLLLLLEHFNTLDCAGTVIEFLLVAAAVKQLLEVNARQVPMAVHLARPLAVSEGLLAGCIQLGDLDDRHLLTDELLVEVLLQGRHVRILTYNLIYKSQRLTVCT